MTNLSPQLIARTLNTKRLGHPALVFDAVGSTNDVCHEQARLGAADGLLVLAEEQTAGRGRLDRTWWAPAGTCLLMSLLLRPGITANKAGQLTMCLGLGAADAIHELTRVNVQLKWPNDLLIGGRKLGGMLAELNVDDGQIDYAVLGLGLNVNLDFAGHGAPPELLTLAASLSQETGAKIDRLELLAAILGHTEGWYDRVLAGESPYEAWAARLDTVGRRVRVSISNGLLEGLAVGATPDGALLVQDDRGSTHIIWSGDVTSVRSG